MTNEIQTALQSVEENDGLVTGNENLQNLPAMANDKAMRAIMSDAQGLQIKAAVIMAKQFPRNETKALENLLAACSRKSLAHKALYAFPKGNTTVTGPTIRLAEAMAARWGNINFGQIQLHSDEKEGFSSILTYAWDLETNSFTNRVTRVRHERKAGGKVHRITDPMEVMNIEGNMASRKLRQCILAVIPVDVQEELITACEKTILQDIGENKAEYMAALASDFETKFKVTVAMLEKRLGHNFDACTPQEVLTLQKLLRGIEDGFMKAADAFPDVPVPPPANSVAQSLTEKYTAKGDAAAAAKAEAAAAPQAAPAQENQPTASRKRGRPAKGSK